MIDADAEAARKKKELMDQEIQKVKQEYEEKQRNKKAKKKSKDDDKDEDKKKDDDSKAEKERDEKVGSSLCHSFRQVFLTNLQIKAIEAGGNAKDKADETARIYALHRSVAHALLDILIQCRRNASLMSVQEFLSDATGQTPKSGDRQKEPTAPEQSWLLPCRSKR